MAAVLVGPAVVTCSSSAEGLGDCLRQQMANIGLFPGRDAAPAAVAEPQTAVTAEPVETAEAAPAAKPAAPAGSPVLNLLRAEPDGSLVLGGTAAPGAAIEIYGNGTLLGTTTAEDSGDWVVVPDQPLPAGGMEITVGVAGSSLRSGQSFVVIIDPNKQDQPLVVATTPGEASDILQGLEQPAVSEPMAVATAEPKAVTPPAAGTAATPPATDTAAAPAAPEEQRTDVAVVAPSPMAADPVTLAEPAAPPPRIDAIEIDGGANFFAGAGAEGATVRLYVNDKFVADAKVADGRWLVEAKGALTLPSQRVRVDMLEPGTADVSSRAEVDFLVDLPEEEAAASAGSEAVAVTAPAAEAATPATEPAMTATAEPEADVAAGAGAEPAAEAVAATEVPVLRAESVGDPEDQRFASGTAIIRRGDNLWTIARRVYGRGIKYTAIYEANETQIRDPNLIYPGQVFGLPPGTPDE